MTDTDTMTNLSLLKTGAAIGIAAAALAFTSRVPTASATAARAATDFAWPGVYDLVGTGFPDGQRNAVMYISKDDSAYTLESLKGPPGELVSFKVTGDSAHVIWNLGSGQMFVDLRGTGDSLIGAWSTVDWQGEIRGARRR